MAEVYYTYTPAVGYVITGDVDLDDRMFFVPRLVTKVQLCATANPTTLRVLTRPVLSRRGARRRAAASIAGRAGPSGSAARRCLASSVSSPA